MTATASFGGKRGKTVESDRFLIYEEGAFDLMPRIAQHYGVELNTILADMRMQDCLTRQGNRISSGTEEYHSLQFRRVK